MPGTYAHLTLVNELREPRRMAQYTVAAEAVSCVQDHFKLCELGAVSPDFPYLDVADPAATVWADEMHCRNTGALIGRGIERVRGMTGEARWRCLAWLLGYVAHVVADVTIHPVVERKVGPYRDNKAAHRECEMHQDAYIYQRLNLGPAAIGRHLACGPGEALDPAIDALWRGMLGDVYGAPGDRPPPNPRQWHRWFCHLVDSLNAQLLPLARHVATDRALVYPGKERVGDEYITGLEVPGGRMDYDDIFDLAIANVGAAWRVAADGVLCGGRAYLARFGNWNLDTGRDQDTGAYVFWR